MATSTAQIQVASSEGYISKKVLESPLRDATDSDIPIIDISRIYSEQLDERKKVAREIGAAASQNGVFYVSNHGIDDSVIDAVQTVAMDFFHQDLSLKMMADVRNSVRYNGYKGLDMKMHANPTEGIDFRETFYVKYDPRLDPSVKSVDEIPQEASKYLGFEDYHWKATENLPNFRQAITDYQRACLHLSRALARSFALSLDVHEDTFDKLVQYPDALLVFNYYTPRSNDTSSPDDQERTVPLGSHTDPRAITILWRNPTGGLQVLNREGQWLNAPVIPGTLLVNVADCLQRTTNGRYVSPVHQVRDWSGQERLSIPFFLGFGLHETCAVLDACVAEGEEKKYVDVQCADWITKRAALLQYGGDREKSRASKYAGLKVGQTASNEE